MINELDDLFRQQLDGHATPPPADLWARLQARTAAAADEAAAAADPLDAQFRAGLAGHATPPRRELWERLEDEHLRPRQRRRPVVAWGRLAVAASLLLFVLAGGAGLWWGTRQAARGPVAAASRGSRQPAGPGGTATGETAATSSLALASAPGTEPAAAQAALAATPATPPATGQRQAPAARLAAETGRRQKNREIFTAQATGLGGSSSSSPVARTAALRRPATAHRPAAALPPTTPQPDAAADPQLALGGRKTPSSQPTTQPAASVLAAASPQLQVIEVEVRRGNRPAASPEPVVAALGPAANETAAEPRRHLRLGGVLRQAGHALRGEPVSLAEATGLPETVTVQAHLGDRVLSRTIRL
ncbi:hypothetical protein HHL22_06440 [Hymenobacter sp. RP-2-7]|uniref:Uncharacterized protein n=1 Tax=Hymenobacter polaris TaxID=2682546 RepID=A0A7Y0ACJ7_9BACT|nr:hypothetical protein [Hymenobacter polaris]NML64840.1 hypothetical protein [Hymenobacter polaris]